MANGIFGDNGLFGTGLEVNDLLAGVVGWGLGGPIPGLLAMTGSNTIGNIRDTNTALEDISVETSDALSGIASEQQGILDRLPITHSGGNLSAEFLENLGIDVNAFQDFGFGPVELGPGDSMLFSPSQVEAATGRSVFSTEGMFDSASAQLDFLRANPLPTSLGIDVGPTRNQITSNFEAMIASLLGLGDVARSEFANVELPETDLSELLSARLAGAGAAGEIRERQAQSLLTSAASSCGGLENTRRASDQLSYQQAGQRALESLGIVSDTRMEELERQNTRSTLQSEAAAGITAAETAGRTGAGTLTSTLGSILNELLGLETRVSAADTQLEGAAHQYESGLLGDVENQELMELMFLLDQEYRLAGSDQSVLRDLLATEGTAGQLGLQGHSQYIVPDLSSLMTDIINAS